MGVFLHGRSVRFPASWLWYSSERLSVAMRACNATIMRGFFVSHVLQEGRLRTNRAWRRSPLAGASNDGRRTGWDLGGSSAATAV
jgi:hypothetical protein